jgi:hypothetical protein
MKDKKDKYAAICKAHADIFGEQGSSLISTMKIDYHELQNSH